MTLTADDLKSTLITLANIPAQREASLGYLPAILFTKWAADKADEPGFLDRLAITEKPVYKTDENPKELVSQALRDPTTYPATLEELGAGIDDIRDVHHHFEVLKHTIRTLSLFKIGDMADEEVLKAFDAYLTKMMKLARTGAYCFQPYAAEIIGRLAGKVSEAYDPFCKTGDLLCAVDADTRIGSEPNPAVRTIAEVRSRFCGKRIDTAEDPISSPLTNADGTLKTFPLVVANIDHLMGSRHREKNPAVSMDVHGRFTLSPTEWMDDAVMLLHALATTADTGRCFILSPAMLQGGFRSLRPAAAAQLHANDWLEAVIRIPGSKNLLHSPTGISRDLQLHLFNKNKDAERKGKILFIDAGDTASEEEIDKICKTVAGYKEIPGYAKIVPLEEIIKSRPCDLNPKCWTTILEQRKAFDKEAVRKEIIQLEGKRLAVLTEILDILEELKTE